MGTRNITSLIMNGEQKVCQYGQWDGYPSYTGVKILEFLRDADMDRLKQALANTTISVVDYENAKTYTGSTKDVSDTVNKVWKVQTELNQNREADAPYCGTYETAKHMAAHGQLTPQEVDDYLVSTRDTGCDILPFIYERSPDRAPLELFAISEEFNGEYSWDIQGIYVIDLDKGAVKMTFDGYSQEYHLDQLPANIEKEMLVFELITGKLYEVNLDSEQKDVQSLSGKASEIALEIGEEIKTEYPDVLDDLNAPIRAEDFGQRYILELLCDKAMKHEKQPKSVDTLVTEAVLKSDKALQAESPRDHGAPER